MFVCVSYSYIKFPIKNVNISLRKATQRWVEEIQMKVLQSMHTYVKDVESNKSTWQI